MNTSSSDSENNKILKDNKKKLVRKRKKNNYRQKQKIKKFASSLREKGFSSDDDDILDNLKVFQTKEKNISNKNLDRQFLDEPLNANKNKFFTEGLATNYNCNRNLSNNSFSRSSSDLDSSNSSSSFSSSKETARVVISSEDKSSSESSSEEIIVNQDETLFLNSKTSVKEFLYSVYLMKMKHKLSDDSVDDFLKLIHYVLPERNKCPVRLKKFENELFNSHNGTFYFMCVKCNEIADRCDFKDFKHKKKFCLVCKSELVSFIQLDFETQLVSILNNEKLKQIKTSVKNSRESLGSEKILNATDGSIYKEHIKNLNKNTLSVSLNLNSDGAPFIKSTSSSLWPVIGTITELNASSKDSFENLIIFGKYILI